MKITILIINILILAALAFLIYKLVKEEWEHIQILEEKTNALMELAGKQAAINDNSLKFQKSQIELCTNFSTRFDEIAIAERTLNEMIKDDRHKIEEFDDILAKHMMDEMNEKHIVESVVACPKCGKENYIRSFGDDLDTKKCINCDALLYPKKE